MNFDSAAACVKAMISGLDQIAPALPTILPQTDVYKPKKGVAYQRVFFVFARPRHDEQSDNYMERGFMQVNLGYPPGEGEGPLLTQFAKHRAIFKPTASFQADGVIVNIEEPPELGAEIDDPTHFIRPVRVRFYAHIIG